jgi:3-hydroxyisobutyrate dehydrogenase-like beta-hydroxyacid dehydrogenase
VSNPLTLLSHSLCREKGGIVAESIEQAIKDSGNSITSVLNLKLHVDVLICMLFDKKSIEDVFLTEERRTLLKGKVLIQMSTISPEETVQLKQSIGTIQFLHFSFFSHCTSEQLNGTYLEAPVLGTSTVAVQGQLQVGCYCVVCY